MFHRENVLIDANIFIDTNIKCMDEHDDHCKVACLSSLLHNVQLFVKEKNCFDITCVFFLQFFFYFIIIN